MSNVDSTTQDGTQASQAEGSENGNGQQSSQPKYVTLEQFNAIQANLDKLTRTLQSEKDRAVKKTNERLDGLEGNLKAVLQTALKDGKDISTLLSDVERTEEAEARQAMLEMAQMFRTGKFPQASSLDNGQAQGVNVSEVLKELELPLEDLRVKAFSQRSFTSKEEAFREGAKLIKTLSKQPTDADQSSTVGERQKSATNQETLQAEYDEKKKNLRGQAFINLKMEYRKKGLDVT